MLAAKKKALAFLAATLFAGAAHASRTDFDGAPLRVSKVERAQLETRSFELALERGVSMQRFRLFDSASIEALALSETRLPAFDFEEPLSRLELLDVNPRNASSCAFSLAAGCLGKTIPADPLDYVDGPNVYAYARNNPLAYSDPMGTCVWIFKDTGYCKAVEEKISETIELVTGDPAAQADQQIAMNQARVAGIKNYEKTVGESPTSNSVVATTADHKGITASGKVIDMSGQIEPANLEAAVIPGAIGARMAARAVAAAGGGVARQVAAGAASAIDDALGEVAGVSPNQVKNLADVATSALVPKSAKSLGRWGEARLAQVLDDAGTKPSNPFKTSTGPRYVDRLVDGIAHEAKAGVDVRLTTAVRRQIEKDVELIQLGRVEGAHWHFFQGATPELLDELKTSGIAFTVH